MAAGIPLTEAEREPWLDRCHAVLAAHATPSDPGIVLACSALTIAARRRLAGDLPVRFVALIASEEVLAARVAAREGHFAGPELLASQLATLELDPEVLTVDAGQPVDHVVTEIRHVLRH
jgi:gluconokinase